MLPNYINKKLCYKLKSCLVHRRWEFKYSTLFGSVPRHDKDSNVPLHRFQTSFATIVVIETKSPNARVGKTHVRPLAIHHIAVAYQLCSNLNNIQYTYSNLSVLRDSAVAVDLV